MCAGGRPTTAQRMFAHDIMQTSRSHHKAEWLRRQKNVFIAAGILVLHTRVAVMSCSGNIHCHAGTSSHSVAQRTHCLVSFLACYGSKPVLRISWANVKKEQMGMWKLVLCESKWFEKEFVHLLKAFVLKGKQTVVFLKKNLFLRNSGLYCSRILKMNCY